MIKIFYPPYVLTCFLFYVSLANVLAQGSVLPSGFADQRLAGGLDGTSVFYAPDGRVFVTQKKGVINIIKNGALLPTPFFDFQNLVDNRNERGLQSIVLDPNFASNGYVYIFYSIAGENRNRVSRLTASGDVAVAGSELILLTLDAMIGQIHNGGALFFKGGKLFVTTGDGGSANQSQSFSSLLGKVLRMNPDGTIPQDNPYHNTLTGDFRLIYALGFRNPFRADVQPGSEKVFINDVGQTSWEEINELFPGKNYGWPIIEGARTTQTAPANYQNPVYAYPRSGGCSIVGGTFYNPQNPTFPARYIGKYFFGDYCKNDIRVLDPNTGTIIETFATNINRPISFSVGADGSFYYMARGGLGGGSSDANSQSCCSEVWRIQFTGSGFPSVSAQPSAVTSTVGGIAIFVVGASGNAPLSYQWQRNGVDIPGATTSRYERTGLTLADNGSRYRVMVTNPLGTVASEDALLTVSANTAPQPQILTPTANFLYTAGTTLTFSGSATDAEDGALPSSAFTWEIVFHHATHTHPAMAPVSGLMQGTYPLSSNHDPASDVWYRIYLTVRDSQGQTTTIYRDVYPKLAEVTLRTNPAGLNLNLDGASINTPFTFTGVSGITRVVQAPTIQNKDGLTYTFNNWSDGGAAQHTIATPATNTTLTANYTTSAGSGACANTGRIQREVWNNIPSDQVSLVPFNTNPSSVSDLTAFEAPLNAGLNFGARIRGYVCAPLTGQYTFWIASNDFSELWLSTDQNPANKVKIAFVNGATQSREWTKSPTQKSQLITLTAGRTYYIEALHKQGVGTDNLSVGWQLPNGSMERPITSNRLIPFDGTVVTPPTPPPTPTPTPTPTPPPTPTTCSASGTIAREVWNNIPGDQVLLIPLNTAPSSVNQLTIFESPVNFALNYGTRVRGYVCAPLEGAYTFWIASNDFSELWLSTDDSPANKRKIAFINGATASREWTRFPNQKSEPIVLAAGKRYYIEALHKQGMGTDNLAVGWQLPNAVMERPIPGSRLSPFNASAGAAGAREASAEEDLDEFDKASSFSVYPNPTGQGTIRLNLSGYIDQASTSHAKLDIISVTGEVVLSKLISCEAGCDNIEIDIDEKYAKGVYIIHMATPQRRLTRKLFVK